MINKTEIRDTAYGGYGVGTMPDGRVIFIPHTVKGDVVTFQVTEDKTNMLYGELVKLTEPSPLRGELYCPHIGKCGGCVFGHISYENQLELKAGFLKNALERNRVEFPEPEIISADFKEFRNRATFRIRDGKIGFYKFKTNDFIPIDECPVIKKSMIEKAKELAGAVEGRSYIYITENEKGEALGRTDAALDSKFSFDGLKSGEKAIGRKHLGFDTRYGTFYVGFNSFLQGNRYISNALQDFVLEHSEGRLGLELYCGSGYLTLPMARKCEKIDAVESYAPSIRLAERTKLKNVTWHVAMSENMKGMGKRSLDMIVADPPRTGMEKEVCNYIKNSDADRFIYISCDPNTFARDAARLSEFYKIEHMVICDMFPGSYHLETMALLRRKK
ncbi:(Uracil-5)-methyltransferase [Denitrovibrio acetiphilus DSM 12809]|uniref:(Uracil-5)-methyltransferase n=1 Tax=Denitrovibrio acetiphilus (strain DSM 12809 / NBRC 114555 / N2460) TaxID=522772 RepID=D4H624_DENA2|nr:TRAM domain-containing protein [Denitrovibrio acetiphilus]ADD67670.1 (Uracil-5)-methyltransferase [Denitrovibrio acetiphilus DSM 12809]